ncbi:dihydrodipicolinate reductase [Roseovarius tibetensis]|uniref:dihydrodipicolinate reductase n=1 Tax=Roseovarius tibetensis TaxID=2685897 RepID=UPI003D7F2EF5
MTLAAPVAAEGFSQITDRSQFVSLIKDRDLSRFGINVNVTPDGDIKGRAFGSAVTGAWRWDGSYFCRDLYWGDMDLGANCQSVELKGNTVRFTSDQGQGRHADLYLR